MDEAQQQRRDAEQKSRHLAQVLEQTQAKVAKLEEQRATAGQDHERALHQLRSALEDRLAGTLSAGQKRRLGLARLMVTARPVWVLDEPTVSLDAASVALFAEAVRAHLGQGGSALMATHIDLGIPEAEVLDLAPFKARTPEEGGMSGGFDEAFE